MQSDEVMKLSIFNQISESENVAQRGDEGFQSKSIDFEKNEKKSVKCLSKQALIMSQFVKRALYES